MVVEVSESDTLIVTLFIVMVTGIITDTMTLTTEAHIHGVMIHSITITGIRL